MIKPHKYCFLCQYSKLEAPAQIIELTGTEYVLNHDKDKYVSNGSKTLISYLDQFKIDTSIDLLSDFNEDYVSSFTGSKINYYVNVFNIMYRHAYTYQQDCISGFSSKEIASASFGKDYYNLYHVLLLDNLIVFSKSTLPISAFALAKKYEIFYWGIINTKLDRSVKPDYFSRIHPNFSVVFFSTNYNRLLSFAKSLAKLFLCYEEENKERI